MVLVISIPHDRPKPQWLEMASHGAEFIHRYGKAPNGEFIIFPLTDKVSLSLQPYNIFSDCFCAAGLAEYSRISRGFMGYRELFRNMASDPET